MHHQTFLPDETVGVSVGVVELLEEAVEVCQESHVIGGLFRVLLMLACFKSCSSCVRGIPC